MKPKSGIHVPTIEITRLAIDVVPQIFEGVSELRIQQLSKNPTLVAKFLKEQALPEHQVWLEVLMNNQDQLNIFLSSLTPFKVTEKAREVINFGYKTAEEKKMRLVRMTGFELGPTKASHFETYVKKGVGLGLRSCPHKVIAEIMSTTKRMAGGGTYIAGRPIQGAPGEKYGLVIFENKNGEKELDAVLVNKESIKRDFEFIFTMPEE